MQQCIHKVDTQCYFSYITDYTPTTEEVCSENYSKRCFIELSKKSVQETSEKCYYPTERVCNPPSEGEVANIICWGVSIQRFKQKATESLSKIF